MEILPFLTPKTGAVIFVHKKSAISICGNRADNTYEYT